MVPNIQTACLKIAINELHSHPAACAPEHLSCQQCWCWFVFWHLHCVGVLLVPTCLISSDSFWVFIFRVIPAAFWLLLFLQKRPAAVAAAQGESGRAARNRQEKRQGRDRDVARRSQVVWLFWAGAALSALQFLVTVLWAFIYSNQNYQKWNLLDSVGDCSSL